MKKDYHFLVLAFLFLLIKTCPAQQHKLTFHYVPPPKGDFFNSVAVTVTQDPQGYMWLAHNGLHRFDGYRYTSYYHNPLDPHSLSGNGIETACVDHNGFIWVSTIGGLDRLDPTTGIFKHFQYHPNDSVGLTSGGVSAILEDHDGMIWVGTNKGLNRFNPKTQNFIHYQHDPADTTTLSNNEVRILYEDRQGTIWVGTGNAFPGNPQTGGLNRFDRKNGTFKRYLHDPNNFQSLKDNRVRAIFEDSRGTFWVGTAGDGLHTMNREKGTFIRHHYDPVHPEKLSRPPPKKPYPWADDHITFIIEDVTGAIWIGTFGNGLNRYDPQTKKVTYYPNFKDNVSGVQTKSAWGACTSKDGMLWICYSEGLFRVNPLQKIIPHIEIGSPVSICEDTSGFLWYTGSSGLIQIDPSSGKKLPYIHDPNNPLNISTNNVYVLYEDRQGILWIGTANSGLIRFERNSGKYTRYLPKPGDKNSLTSSTIGSILEDTKGDLWIGTDKGLNVMNRQTGTFTHYLNNPKDPYSISNNEINCIYEDQYGNLWIGNSNGGLNRMSRQTGKFQHFMNRVNVFSLYQDSKGILWAGTSSGLYRSNIALNGFTLFTDPNNEIAGNTIVSGILEDDQGNLWLNASVGICMLNSQRSEVIIHSREPGWGLAVWSETFKSRKGKLFFGSTTGYYAFFPEQLRSHTIAPEVVISGFRVANKPVIPGKEGPLLKPLAQTKEIHLNHRQNVFSFDFAGIHYSNPENNRHSFMLEGIDNDWRKVGEEKTAYYYNVPAGRYIFRVKAANSDGVWAENAIAVVIHPPWWRTGWAYAMYAMMLIAGIWTIVSYRSRSLRRELEQRKKEQQLVELQQQKTELEMQALRSQMNPHFIFNCLSSINSFILKNETEIASDYLTRFSRLVRMVLNSSRQSIITLEDELEMLRLYLDLERLRFKNSFSYNISVANNIDASSLLFPPLLLQPFAENAIWHGLMHKEEEGQLEVQIDLEKNVLSCKITDDGIGRKMAGLYKSKSVEKHKSMGMQITLERLAHLSQDIGTAFCEVEDLKDVTGHATGTRVTLKINYTHSLEEAFDKNVKTEAQ